MDEISKIISDDLAKNVLKIQKEYNERIARQGFKGSINVDYCDRFEVEYISTGLIRVKGRTKNEALERLIARLRADADFIEQNMIHDESTNQG